MEEKNNAQSDSADTTDSYGQTAYDISKYYSYWYSNLQNQDNTDYTESIETLIRRAQIPIKAVLGNSMISVNDFAMLQPGDIIRLDRKVEDE